MNFLPKWMKCGVCGAESPIETALRSRSGADGRPAEEMRAGADGASGVRAEPEAESMFTARAVSFGGNGREAGEAPDAKFETLRTIEAGEEDRSE